MTSTEMPTEQRIARFVFAASWVISIAATAVGLIFFSLPFALGIACGGLIVTANFSLLSRTLTKTLDPARLAALGSRRTAVYRSVLVRYYLRFLISGVIIFLLLAGHVVNPLGLIIGLSVVVASIFLALAYELTFHYKEAR